MTAQTINLNSTEMRVAYCLASTTPHAVNTMSVDWCWQPLGNDYFQGPPGFAVKPISRDYDLETVPYKAIVFLGYDWFKVRNARRTVGYFTRSGRNTFIGEGDLTYIAELHRALKAETDKMAESGACKPWSDEQIEDYICDWPCWLEQREDNRDAAAHILDDMSDW